MKNDSSGSLFAPPGEHSKKKKNNASMAGRKMQPK
jgi:hypothetical protein